MRHSRTRKEAKEAILARWTELPSEKRQTESDAIHFIFELTLEQPELTGHFCMQNGFLDIMSWLLPPRNN